MDDKDKELLAGFHHTISEQLDSRLSESPKFFGLLVLVSTGYGYVLSEPKLCKFITLATALALAATLWASWYLAALGYAFRFLQTTQHRIEHALQWSKFALPSGETPESLWRKPREWFWLLPGIYHAHAGGLCLFLVFICLAFCHYHWDCWSHRLLLEGGLAASLVGVCVIGLTNLYYLKKFIAKRDTVEQRGR